MPSNLDSKFNEFARGLTTPLRALSLLLSHPKLITLSILPIVITFLVVIALIYFALTGAWTFATRFLSGYFPDQAWIGGTLFVFLAAIVVGYFVFHAVSIIVSLVASPFNEMLSEQTEKAYAKKLAEMKSAFLGQVFLLDLRKTALSLFFIIILSLIGFIPGIGLISIPGFALVQAFTFVTYPQNRRALGIFESVQFIRTKFFRCLGFGLTTAFLFGIPVLDLFALPIAVVGGTLLYLEE